MEKISVLIPVYNRQNFIREALESVCNQGYEDLDIIIYNDGSTDSTMAQINIIKDPRIRVIGESVNKGIRYTRNKLIEACETKYACWVDSDDIIVKDKIEKQFKLMNEDKVIFTNWVWLLKAGSGWGTSGNCTNAKAFATVMFPVNKEIKFNDKKKFGGEDWDWLKKMLEIYKEDEIKEVLYNVRGHEDRIGFWKRKIRKKFKNSEMEKYSYAELIERYKNE